MGKIWIDGEERDETPEEEADRIAAFKALEEAVKALTPPGEPKETPDGI